MLGVAAVDARVVAAAGALDELLAPRGVVRPRVVGAAVMRGIGANSESELTRSGCVAAKSAASAVPSVSANTAARSDPAASSTASMSSICTSSGAGGTRSDIPLPRRSNWTRRANVVSRSNIRASRGSVQTCSHLRDPRGDEQHVVRAAAGDLVGDRDVAVARVARAVRGHVSP